MAFPRAALLSALLASASIVTAAPFPSSCDVDLHRWGAVTILDTPLSLGDSGKIVVGGNPLYFATAVCSEKDSGSRGLEENVKGYLVNANDPSQCLTASNLDQKGATFSLQDCRFNGAGDVWSSQSFAWTFDNNGASNSADGYFNGENFNFVNASSPPIYTLRTELQHPNVDGYLGELIADYTPNISSLPSGQLKIPMTNVPVTAPSRPPTLNCTQFTSGQVIFNNETSSSNQYNGPLNSKWEAQNDTSDQFVFEQCDYSPIGLKAQDDYVYGRMRPGTDLGNGAFTCYYLTDDIGASNSGHVPDTGAWINGFQVDACSYSAKTSLDIVKYNKTDNTFNYVPFGNASVPGVMKWYTQADYDREYDVKQYVWDAAGVGQVYLSPDNKNLTKYPPATVTFKASPGA